MPNISIIFRQEITRIARREIRSQTLSLRKSSAQYRREIAELKRQGARLKSEVARLSRQTCRDTAPQHLQDESARLRFSAKSVIAQRKRLGISAVDCGKLIGVSAPTIYAWEHGTSRPRKALLTALVTLRNLGKREAHKRPQDPCDGGALLPREWRTHTGCHGEVAIPTEDCLIQPRRCWRNYTKITPAPCNKWSSRL